MKKTSLKKLKLNRETLARLDSTDMNKVAAGVGIESRYNSCTDITVECGSGGACSNGC